MELLQIIGQIIFALCLVGIVWGAIEFIINDKD